MSQINVRNLSNENDDGAPDIVGVSTFSATSYFVPPVGSTAERPTNPQEGDLRFNTDTASLEYFRGDTINWTQMVMTSPDLNGGARGVRGGGNAATDTIEYYTISTLGNSVDFGNLTSSGKAQMGAASRTRGLWAGGETPSATADWEYITISSTGNAIDAGDLTEARALGTGFSNQTRALFSGGYGGGSGHRNLTDYVAIPTTGNAVDFGDTTYSQTNAGACASSTRGIVAGGQSPGYVNTICYFTTSTTGNAADFGDLTVARRTLNGGSNSIRGIFAGGQDTSPNTDNNCVNTIDYITIASTGNAADFGDLTTGSQNGKMNTFAPGFSPTRGVWPGGMSGGGTAEDTMQYVEIATLGNALEFGEVADSTGRYGPGGFSNAHGGL